MIQDKSIVKKKAIGTDAYRLEVLLPSKSEAPAALSGRFGRGRGGLILRLEEGRRDGANVDWMDAVGDKDGGSSAVGAVAVVLVVEFSEGASAVVVFSDGAKETILGDEDGNDDNSGSRSAVGTVVGASVRSVKETTVGFFVGMEVGDTAGVTVSFGS